MQRSPLLAAVTAALVMTVAGCGSSDDESATQQWADGLCSSLTTWTDSLKQIGSSLTDPGSLSVDSVTQAVDEAASATQTLVGDVKDLGPPDTESGQEAQDAVEELANELDDNVQMLSDEFGGGSQSLTQMLSKISDLTGTLATMASEVRSTFQQLDDVDAKGELSDALEQSSSCDAFTS